MKVFKVKVELKNYSETAKLNTKHSFYLAGAPAPVLAAAGLGPWNPNLGGGVLSFLASLDLFLTTLEWMAQLTQ